MLACCQGLPFKMRVWHIGEAAEKERSDHQQQPAPIWHSALHASYESSMGLHAAAIRGENLQGGRPDPSAGPNGKTHLDNACRWIPGRHPNANAAPFDLYVPSSKLAIDSSRQTSTAPMSKSAISRLPSGDKDAVVQENSDSSFAEMGHKALHQPSIRLSVQDLAYGQSSIVVSGVSPESSLVGQSCADAAANLAADDSSAVQSRASAAAGPAAAEAAVRTQDKGFQQQGSTSLMPPSLDADVALPRKASSSVHFLIALDSCSESTESAAQSLAASPEPPLQAATGAAVPAEVAPSDDEAHEPEEEHHNTEGRSTMRTVSSASATSLKSSLKSSDSRTSVTLKTSHSGMSHTSTGSMLPGVNFAVEEDAGQSTLLKDASDAFPAWLTLG